MCLDITQKEILLMWNTLKGFGHLNIRQVIGTVKYPDDLVIMTKEETALQGTTDRVTETGRFYGMETDVEKTKVMRN
jgi:hypothetical protein